MRKRPAPSPTRAAAGWSAVAFAGRIAAIRSPSITTVRFGSGDAPVMSITVTPAMTIVPPASWLRAGGVAPPSTTDAAQAATEPRRLAAPALAPITKRLRSMEVRAMALLARPDDRRADDRLAA